MLCAVQVRLADHIPVAYRPDSACAAKYLHHKDLFARVKVTAVVSNTRTQVAVVEAMVELPDGVPLSLDPVPHIILSQAPGATPTEARALLKAPLPASAALEAPIFLWVQLEFQPLAEGAADGPVPDPEPEVEQAAKEAFDEADEPPAGPLGAPVHVKPSGPPTDPPSQYHLSGVLCGCRTCALPGVAFTGVVLTVVWFTLQLIF